MTYHAWTRTANLFLAASLAGILLSILYVFH